MLCLVNKVLLGWEQWLRTELEQSDEVPETVAKAAMLQILVQNEVSGTIFGNSS